MKIFFAGVGVSGVHADKLLFDARVSLLYSFYYLLVRKSAIVSFNKTKEIK
jgi:hypothetical protein